MGNPAGVRRDFEELERRRLRRRICCDKGFIKLKWRDGWERSAVGEPVGTTTGTRGQAGVAQSRSGRAQAASEPRRTCDGLRNGLKRGPQALGYETALWTSWRVAYLIEQECGVKYHPSQAWRILRQLGWSCQRPTGRALERDEEKIRRMETEALAERLKKSPPGRPHDRLHRRERTERAAPPLPHLGTKRTNAGAAVPLQLEDAFGYGRGHMVELLLPSFSWRHSFAAGDPVPRPSAMPHTRKVVDRLGRASGAPQRRSLGLHPATARAIWIEFLPAYAPELNPVEYCGPTGSSTSYPISARPASVS